MMTLNETAATCPLCGRANQCAIAAGQPPQSCWCQAVTVDAVAKVKAADSANERCLCPACGQPAEAAHVEG